MAWRGRFDYKKVVRNQNKSEKLKKKEK